MFGDYVYEKSSAPYSKKVLLVDNDDLYQHVWEGKCRSLVGLLFKEFGSVDAFPICIDAHDAASVIASSPIHAIFVIGFRIVCMLSGCGVGRL